MVPREVSHYRILQQLGQGGMGIVYLAEDVVLGRRVALKFLPPEVLSDPKRVQRFEHEARTISALNHPNILTIHELGRHDSFQYIATEYIDGQTLRERMRSPIPIGVALDIVSQIATGLSAAHRAGIVHRDLKPENVMIRTDGIVKLLDFGVASLMEQATAVADLMHTAEHEIVGTLPYMSPEQLRGQSGDARNDIYSLAVVVYEMIAGRRPFDALNKADLIAAIIERPAPPLSRVVVDVPAVVDQLVGRMLAKDPRQRPADIGEVLSELADAQRSLQRSRVSAPTALGRPSVQSLPPTNLPADLQPLIGRELELGQLQQLIADPGLRLITLTGAGGTGKTRLAIAAAARVRDEFPGGVFLASLASLSSAALVLPTIAEAVGVKEVADEPLMTSLQRHLSNRGVLLVIDNFEQVMDAAHAVQELLAGAPQLTVLVTSRTALRVRGEREFPVPPLSVPARSDSATALAQNPAIALFLARATDVNPAFALTNENAPIVLAICRRLDGLPLAIELAAARMKVLAPATILRKLEEPLSFLSGGARDLPKRQQTMRSAIEWSYGLLTAEEQILFRRLAVFSGGCTTEAVERICASGFDADQMLDYFSALVDKSLVSREPTAGPEPRFSMLQTIHDFAAELLASSPERADLQRAHADYFVGLAERIESELYAGAGAVWLSMLEGELHNIRSAINWSIETSATERGLRLTTALLPFWLRRAHATEGLDHLKRLLDAGEHSADQRLRALHAAGVLAEAQGKYPESRSYFQLNLEMHRGRRDAWGIANALNNLGIVSLREENPEAAGALYEESLAIWRQVGNRPGAALSLQNLGNVARLATRYADARARYVESQTEFEALGDQLGVAKCLNLLGDLAREEGNLEEARRLGEESLQIFMRLTEHREVAICLADLGKVEQASGNWTEAYSLYDESLVIFRELGDPVAASRVLDSLATLAAQQDRPEHALRLAAAAAGLRRSHGARISRREQVQLERLLQPVRTAAGHERAVQLSREGDAMSLDEAVALSAQLA